jgi:hypothetical protein
MKSFMVSHSRQARRAYSGVDGLTTLAGTSTFFGYSFSKPLVDMSSKSKSARSFIGPLVDFNFRARRGALPLFIMLLVYEPPAAARTEWMFYYYNKEPSSINETEFLLCNLT